MKLFDVYPLFDIELEKASGSFVWDIKGEKYLDFYGGHAVISIGHSHPHHVKSITEQLNKIAFYSNSVKIPLQQKLAEKLGQLSGYQDYELFLCNSGAEANENALKLASFHNGRKKVVVFSMSFHGRTSAAVAATDDASIIAPINQTDNFVFLPFNDESNLEQHINDETCAVIIEGIQGVGGINIPSLSFMKKIEMLCNQTGAIFILDEVQSGYGRSGKFFAHQHFDVKPDIISIAKGMGNGFPIGGIIIHPKIKSKYSMLGTTFGGNHLACAAALSVLEVIENENLIDNAERIGNYIIDQIKGLKQIKEIRAMGLMIGLEFDFPIAGLRNQLLKEHQIFTGTSSKKNTLRLLPALNINQSIADIFINALKTELNKL
jgi:acetylornithine/N-succinyldiaminopimelate aminotransferase